MSKEGDKKERRRKVVQWREGARGKAGREEGRGGEGGFTSTRLEFRCTESGR